MLRREWIENDLSFYHITQTKSLESIFKTGLKNKNGFGICVVRTKDELIVRYICEMMLNVSDDLDFSIIEIKPSSIQLRANEIFNDDVEEITNCLHNYIKRESIVVTADNIVGTFRANPLGIPNVTEYENEIRNSVILEKLQ